MKPLNTKASVILMGLFLAHCGPKKDLPTPSVQPPALGGVVQSGLEGGVQSQPVEPATSSSVANSVHAPLTLTPPTQGSEPIQPAASVPAKELQAKLADSEAPKTIEPAACLTFSFQHHAATNHALGPDCAHHKNRIALPTEILKGEHDLNRLCVKVDGVPVMSVREKDSLILGAAPRSRSIISVRACRKGVQCQESCKIPKDELISDLAGDSEDSETGWDSESALKVNGAIDDTIKRELAALDEEEISKEWSLDGTPTEQLATGCNAGAKKTLTARKRN